MNKDKENQNTQNKKNLFFDLDGTLINSNKLCYEAFNSLNKEHGYKFDTSVIETSKSFELRNIYKGLTTDQFKDVVLKFDKYYFENYKNVELFDGAFKFLEAISKNNNLYIATSNCFENVVKILKEKGIFNFFISGTYGGYGSASKGQRIQGMLKEENILNTSSIMIGDTVSDIEAGRENDFKIIACDWGIQSGKVLSEVNPDFLVSSFDQMREAIEQV